MNNIIKIDKNNKNQITEIVKKVAQVLKQGGVIIFPTETVYGIGADANNKEAVSRIYEIKNRDKSKPLALHIGSLEYINKKFIPEKYKNLVKDFLPGPLTLIVNDEKGESLGIRYPSCSVFLRIAEEFGFPIAGTSANISDQGSVFNVEDIHEQIINKVDLVIDAGDTLLKKESTIVDLRGDELEVIREGAVRKEQLYE